MKAQKHIEMNNISQEMVGQMQEKDNIIQTLKIQLTQEVAQKNQKDDFFKQKIMEMENQVKLFIENDHKQNQIKIDQISHKNQIEMKLLNEKLAN